MDLNNFSVRGPCMIIGGGGWMGSFLTHQLVQFKIDSIHIVDIVRPKDDLKFCHVDEKVIFHECDISKADDVLRLVEQVVPLVVFHMAAVIDLRVRPHANLHRVNVVGTENIIKAMNCLDTSVTRYLIYTSSIDVATGLSGMRDVEDNDPYPADASNKYQLSKIAAEQLVVKANSSHLKTISLRPGHVFGPYDPIIDTVLKFPFAVGPSWPQMSLVFVGNAAFAHILALYGLLNETSNIQKKDSICGQCYFITDFDENFCDFYFRLANRKPSIFRIPDLILRVLIWIVEFIQIYLSWLIPIDFFHPVTGLSSESVKPCVYFTVRSDRARHVLNYKPSSTPSVLSNISEAKAGVISREAAIEYTQKWLFSRN